MFENLSNLQEEIERRKRDLSGLVSPVVPVQDEAEPAPSPAPVEESKPDNGSVQSFLDILKQNDEYRQMASKDFEREEKARKARLTLASLSDGISALGNLIGTTHGAFSQPQTYSIPGVSQSINAERERDLAMAERLRTTDESIRIAKAKLEAAEAQAREKAQQAMELENARFEHNRELVGLRGEEARATETKKHENRTEEEGQKQAGREAIVEKRTESQERIAAGRNATSRANTQDRIAANGNTGKSGLTETGRAMQIQRDAELAVQSELAPELRRRGVNLPYGWEKNWKRYVQSAPDFYDKYYRRKGWEDIGGNAGNVSGTDGKVGGFRTGGNRSTGKKGGFKK